jgi:hypothetical protein
MKKMDLNINTGMLSARKEDNRGKVSNVKKFDFM